MAEVAPFPIPEAEREAVITPLDEERRLLVAVNYSPHASQCYVTLDLPGIGGGVWRAPSRAQTFAAQGAPNPQWYATLRKRPALDGTTE